MADRRRRRFGGGANARDLNGFQAQQAMRLADFSLPLRLKERYQNLAVKPAYETIDGKPVVVLTGNPYPNVTEELAFDRDSGLLVRRDDRQRLDRRLRNHGAWRADRLRRLPRRQRASRCRSAFGTRRTWR